MTCKNCEQPMVTSQKYCGACGAKVIRNRLSFRNLWEDFRDRFLDYDNTFLVTIAHLFTHPERVIGGYLDGVRRRYMDPLSYLGIALTLSGIQLFVTRKISDRIDWNIYDQEISPELGQKLMDSIFDYSSLIFLLYIPVFALAAWVAMNKAQLFLSETMIVFVYIMAHWSIVLFLPTVAVLLLVPEFYMQLSFPMLLFILGYAIYCLQRMQRFSTGALIWRSLLFFILVVIGYFGIIVGIYLLMFATGAISLQDFTPAK